MSKRRIQKDIQNKAEEGKIAEPKEELPLQSITIYKKGSEFGVRWENMSIYELLGFVELHCNPQFVKTVLQKSQEKAIQELQKAQKNEQGLPQPQAPPK